MTALSPSLASSTGLVAQTVCYCRGSDAAHQIEMIEFTHLALPDIAALLG